MKKSRYVVLLVLMGLLGVVACSPAPNQTDAVNEAEEAVSEAAPVEQAETVSEVVAAEAAPAQNEGVAATPAEAEVVANQVSTLQFIDAYADW